MHPESKITGPAQTWSATQAVNFEVALDILTLVAAKCSAQIADADPADAAAIARWTTLRVECTQVRTGLDPTDDAAVEQVTAQYSALLKSLRDA